MKTKRKIAIGITGPFASGKSTVSNYLRNNLEFEIIRTRDIVAQIALESGLDDSDKSLQEIGAKLQTDPLLSLFCDKIIFKVESSKKSVIIDSIRPLLHLERLKKLNNFFLLYIFSPNHRRINNYLNRSGGRENDLESFRERNGSPIEMGVKNLMNYADIIINNSSSIERFKQKVCQEIYPLMFPNKILYFQEVVDFVINYHRKHGYSIGTQEYRELSYAIGLMIEELGEIHECISKNKPNIGEEHADLLYLLLGNCISTSIDIEKEIAAKHIINMNRNAKSNWLKE